MLPSRGNWTSVRAQVLIGLEDMGSLDIGLEDLGALIYWTLGLGYFRLLK